MNKLNMFGYCIYVILNLLSLVTGIYDFPQVINRSNVDIADDLKLRSVSFAIENIVKFSQFERNLANSRIQVQDNSISHGQYIDSIPSGLAIAEEAIAIKMLKSTKHLIDTICNGNYDRICASAINGNTLPDCDLNTQCFKIKNTTYVRPYRRLLPADYKDGLHSLRASSDGVTPLPNPREVTSHFFTSHMNNLNPLNHIHYNEEGILDNSRNIFLAAFTQFIEQDLARTVVRTMANGQRIECCDFPFRANPRNTHPACDPLEISPNDPFYKTKHVQCLNYVRSSLSTDCTFGPANQNNEASDVFDLSQLYGASRKFKNGLLETTETNSLLNNGNLCLQRNSTNCYISGDPRVNSNPYITIIHTIFLRNHNNYAKITSRKYPNWNDEQIFQYARQLNIGLYQKIIYNDWSKIILGEKISYKINTEIQNSTLHSGVSNEFATAAIRFYNSMLPGDLLKPKYLRFQNNLIDSSIDQSTEFFKLQDVYYRPINLSSQIIFDEILNAVLHQRAMAMDTSLVDDLSMQYYRSAQIGDYGTDVLALDILRGRDHGITGYAKYASFCNQKVITSWTDLVGLVRNEDIERLRSVYKSVEDVDLIMGLLSEIHITSGTVGPTMSCIIGEQLKNSGSNDPNFFTKHSEALSDILTKTLLNLLCETTNLREIPKNPFLVSDHNNELIECHNLS